MVPARSFIIIVLVATLPLAAAEWRGAGGLEPDTAQDIAGGIMFPDPDTTPAGTLAQVYFHAFAAAPETSLNPNLGLTGTRLMPAPALHHRALLGVWKDCNDDGYIGLAESALQDYPSALLLDDRTCPETTYVDTPLHHTGGWVRELLMIGMVDPCEHLPLAEREARCPGVDAFAPNERVIYAEGTYVWGDLGAPGSIPSTECVLAPLPSGTTRGSGAVIAWADCQSRRGIAQSVNGLDSDGTLGLRFEDPQHPEASSSHLNQRFPVTPFGDGERAGLLQDDASTESARVWDCGDEPIATVEDPQGRRELALADPSGRHLSARTFPFVVVYTLTGVGFADEDANADTPGVLRVALTDDEGRYATVPALGAVLVDPTASSWLAAERAVDGPLGDCDASTSSRLAPVYFGGMVESDATPILEARKDRTSVTLVFFDGHRGLHPSLDPHTGPFFPSDGGTMLLDHGRGGDGPMWNALGTSEQDPQLIDREDLGFTSAIFVTYYATIGADARRLDLPGGGEPRTYGEENCGDQEAGLHRGWVCDPSLWWRDASGQDNTPRYALGQRIGRIPGDLYHLRDVDCYDGDVARGLGLHASLVGLTDEGPCA